MMYVASLRHHVVSCLDCHSYQLTEISETGHVVYTHAVSMCVSVRHAYNNALSRAQKASECLRVLTNLSISE